MDTMRVKQNIADIAGIDVCVVRDDEFLGDDLGLDSLDMIELIMALEEDFDIELDDDQFTPALTVGDTINIVREALQ